MLYFEDFKEGQKFKFIANVSNYKTNWQGKKTKKTFLTKNKVYDAVIKKDPYGFLISFKDDQLNEHEMSYEYADGKIDILEEISNFQDTKKSLSENDSEN
ncbi:hypothetical protein KLEB273_gp172 [Bacillus phage vB_BauM_KLEB27-3]|nr:hypothetical protein KLEB273_gp172 [Bacillus phage vB_BauM_KLEB27-3]